VPKGCPQPPGRFAGKCASSDLRLGAIVCHTVEVWVEFCSAEDLASLAGLSVCSLHRLFARYVGVGPKWVVRRSRVQEAADRVAREEHVDWVRTALELGYHDQAHFIRDFRAQVGFTPAAYARRCALGRG